MSLLDEVLARKQTALATATEPGTVPAHGTTAGTTLVFDGSDMVWGATSQAQVVILGARAPHMTGWQLDDADGCYVQSSASVAGEIVFPLSLSTLRTLVDIEVDFYRTGGGGAVAATVTAAVLERRPSGAGPSAPGSWVAVATTSVIAGVPSWARKTLTITADTPHVPDASYSYRLRVTGEAGANAQAIKILDMKASVQ